jgi:alanine racemase
MARALKAYIDCQALQHNLATVRGLVPGKGVLAMIKANGYGHGIIKVAKALDAADAFGVACIEEAIQLREAGIQNRIILMEGFFQAEEELPMVVKYDLEAVIHQAQQIEALAENPEFPLRVWIKINTGMHRLGFPVALTQEIWQRIKAFAHVRIEGMMTHFARADELECAKTVQQMALFFAAVKGLEVKLSLANSAGILGWPKSHGDWVRPGLLLYGATPFVGRIGKDEGLQPVMTLSSEIIAIQNPGPGEEIGYGGVFVCEKVMRIGVVAVGYGDGYPRNAPAGTPVLVKGKYAPLVGRVSMDMITVDLSEHPEAKVGDGVELWGPNLPVESVATAMGTSPYELLTGLSTRVAFHYSS